MAGTGIGTFSDRLRDAVRGGGPFDADPRSQGFANGVSTDPNGSPNGTPAEQRARLLHYQDLIQLGLAGNLRDYTLHRPAPGDGEGHPGRLQRPARRLRRPARRDRSPTSTRTTTRRCSTRCRTSCRGRTSMADRVRMNTLALATTALAQSPSFWHAGTTCCAPSRWTATASTPATGSTASTGPGADDVRLRAAARGATTRRSGPS